MPFSKTWKVLEKNGFSNWQWEVLNFCLRRCYYIQHNPLRNHEIWHRKYRFMGFQNVNGNGFGNLALEMFWKYFKSILYEPRGTLSVFSKIF